MTDRSLALRSALFIALAAAVASFGLSAVALAGPHEPTLNLTELRARLDAQGGTLPGYLKTVVKGSAITTIPLTVEAITYGSGVSRYDMTSLILFKASGPVIDQIGGIASGMSGSPIYVADGGTDKLIGALSYGDIFTLNGAGLATPIEYMSAIQDDYAAMKPGSVLPLSRPVAIDGTVKTRVEVRSGSAGKAPASWDTLAVKPLNAVYVGGIDPNSNMFKAISERFAANGAQVLSSPAVGSVESTYDAPFTAGSSLGVLASRGDLWMGGVGTVTYVDGTTVVGFGHPAWWSGPSAMFMTNAWVDGIWPSSYSAYKLARPGALRGTLTQDRYAGVLGVDGVLPGRMPITSRATNTATGKTVLSTSELAGIMADQPNTVSSGYYGLASIAAYISGGKVFDQQTAKGSALTTTTVRVSDGAQTYTVTRRNLYSSGWDIRGAVIADVDDIVGTLQSMNVTETVRAHLVSVDLQSTFSSQRKEAWIADVTLAKPLQTGDNVVTVAYRVNSDPTTRTLDIPITIPAGMPAYGRLTIAPASGRSSYGWWYWYSPRASTLTKPVSQVVDELNAKPDNSTIKVTFTTSGNVAAGVPQSVESSVTPTGYVFSYGATRIAPRTLVFGSPSIVNYRGRPIIFGYTEAQMGTMTISAKGLADSRVPIRNGFFVSPSAPLTKTTTFSAVPSGPGIVGTAASVRVVVRPPVRPEWTRWSNEIVYGSRSRRTARLTAKLPVSGAYAVLTIAAPGGPVRVYSGYTGSARAATTFPAWNGLDRYGRRLPTGRYTWKLVLSKKGYTQMTTTGTIHVSRS